MSKKYHKVSSTEDGNIAINAQSFKIMARGALSEIKGISKTFETIAPSMTEAFNSKKHRNGVEIEFEEDGVVIDVYMSVRSDFKIVEVAENVQRAVHEMIQNMTSMKAKAVYAHVVSIDFE